MKNKRLPIACNSICGGAPVNRQIDPMLRKWVRIQVARDREAEARDLVASLLQPQPGAVES